MSKDELDLLQGGGNPLTDAILEAAEDAEKGRSWTAPAGGAADPLSAADVVPSPLDAPGLASSALADAAPEPAPVEPEEPPEPAAPKPPRESLVSRLSKVSPYTMALVVALVAVLVGVLLLALEMHSLGWQIKPDV